MQRDHISSPVASLTDTSVTTNLKALSRIRFWPSEHSHTRGNGNTLFPSVFFLRRRLLRSSQAGREKVSIAQNVTNVSSCSICGQRSSSLLTLQGNNKIDWTNPAVEPPVRNVLFPKTRIESKLRVIRYHYFPI